MRRCAVLLTAPLSLLAACSGGEGHVLTVPAPVVSVSAAATATATAPLTAATTPVLAPLSKDGRPACDIAKEARNSADSAISAGRNYRALRLVEKANRLCPTEAAKSWGVKLTALSKLDRDDLARDLAKEITAAPSADPAVSAKARAVLASAPLASQPSGDSLLAAALTAQKNNAADARAQLDRALARLAQESNDKAHPYLDGKNRSPLAISSDGATVAIADNTTAVLLDAKTLKPQRFFDLGAPPLAARLSSDGKLFATIADGAVDVWSAATGKHAFHLVWSGETPKTAVFSPDGKRLFVGGRSMFDTTIRAWNLETGDSADNVTLKDQGGVSAIALSRDGKQLAVGTERGSLEIWAASPLKQIVSLSKQESFLAEVRSLAFSPKGDRLLMFSRGGKVDVFDVKATKRLWETKAESPWDEGAATFSEDGGRVLSSGAQRFDQTLREWDAATGAELQNRPVTVAPEMFSESGRYAFGGGDEQIAVLDTVTSTSTVASNNWTRLYDLRFSPPRMIIATLLDEKARRFVTPEGTRYMPVEDTYGSYATSLDGKLYVHLGFRNTDVRDIDTGAPVTGYPGVPEGANLVRFAPDGAIRTWARHFDDLTEYTARRGDAAFKPIVQMGRKNLHNFDASDYGRYGMIDEGKKLLVIDMNSGDLRTADEDPNDRIHEWVLSPDGSALFVGRSQRIARFDAATAKATHTGLPVPCYVDRLASSFDGTKLLAACSELVTLFTFAPGQEAPSSFTFKFPRLEYEKSTLAPHGDLIAMGYPDGSVHVYDTLGRERAEVRFAKGSDATLVIARDGRVLLAGKDAAKLDDRLSCRIGSRGVPFAVCADALVDDDLLAEVLAPAN